MTASSLPLQPQKPREIPSGATEAATFQESGLRAGAARLVRTDTQEAKRARGS